MPHQEQGRLPDRRAASSSNNSDSSSSGSVRCIVLCELPVPDEVGT